MSITPRPSRPTSPSPTALVTILACRRALLRGELLRNIAAASRPSSPCSR
ncbi:hypothetical protein TA3x_003995 [Tundrisphaera sp. TA3]